MEGLVLNGPFPVINIKISEIRQYSGDFVICYRKSCHFKTAQHLIIIPFAVRTAAL